MTTREPLLNPAAPTGRSSHAALDEAGGPPKMQGRGGALAAAFAVFLVAGTASTCLTKVMYATESTGEDGRRDTFRAPLAQSFAMFAGMALCLPLWGVQEVLAARGGRQRRGGRPGGWRDAALLAVPAAFDLVGTQLLNVSLIWIAGSEYQMLRGSVIVWTALFRRSFLRRTITRRQWAGVWTVVAALVAVGAAAMAGGEGGGGPSSTAAQRASGIVLVLVSQAVQSGQYVIEETLLQDLRAPPLFVVGMEGVWGALALACVVMPAVSAASHGLGNGDGVHESVHHNLLLLRNNDALLAMYLSYVVVITFFNAAGVQIVRMTDAVTRNVLDAARTVLVWGALLLLHYEADSSVGEGWVRWWSPLQLVGFALLTVGIVTYSRAAAEADADRVNVRGEAPKEEAAAIEPRDVV